MPTNQDLEALIGRAQAGEARAFEELVAGHLGLVRRFARAFAGNDADADDLAQDALLKAYRSLGGYRFQSAFSTWLYAIVRNQFLDCTKSRAGKERAVEEQIDEGHLESATGDSPIDDQLVREEERRRVWRALGQVPTEYRTTLVLFDLEGLTYDEVAAIERIPMGTVKSRLSRGRERLRQLLLADGESAAGNMPATVVVPPMTEGGYSP